MKNTGNTLLRCNNLELFLSRKNNIYHDRRHFYEIAYLRQVLLFFTELLPEQQGVRGVQIAERAEIADVESYKDRIQNVCSDLEFVIEGATHHGQPLL